MGKTVFDLYKGKIFFIVSSFLALKIIKTYILVHTYIHTY